VQLARGDIVAVDGQYAVRISEVAPAEREYRGDGRSAVRSAVPAEALLQK
jgi:hypothetical protein